MVEKFHSNFENKNINNQKNTTESDLSQILEKNWINEIKTKFNSFKNSLDNLKEKYNNETLLQANKTIREILTNPHTTDLTLVEKTNNLLHQFLSPSYKNESLQKSYAKILAVIDLANWTEVYPEEIQLRIKEVLMDSNLPYIIKKNFVKWLKEKDFLMWDPIKRIKIQNYCEINFPKYNWETFQLTLDPQDWNLAYTDMFAG